MEQHAERRGSIARDSLAATSALEGTTEVAVGSVSASERGNLLEALTQRVMVRSGRQLARLEVSVENGAVKATGIAYSFYAKQLVTHTLLDGAPHLEVLNCLHVQPRPQDAD